MSFDQHSSSIILDMMRSMSYMLDMDLGRHQHGRSKFIMDLGRHQHSILLSYSSLQFEVD